MPFYVAVSPDGHIVANPTAGVKVWGSVPCTITETSPVSGSFHTLSPAPGTLLDSIPHSLSHEKEGSFSGPMLRAIVLKWLPD